MKQIEHKITKGLTSINCLVSFFVWLPAWLRIIERHSAKDYSLLSMGIIMFLQLSNLTIACIEKSKNLRLYLAINSAIVLITILLIVRYQ